jgi:hypothetical protein
MEKNVSHSNSSLALEEKEEVVEPEFDLFIRAQHLSISDAPAVQKLTNVVKVSGSITVSF